MPAPYVWQRCVALVALLAATATAASGTKKAAAEYYVSSLPGLPDHVPQVQMHAGHIEVTPDTNGNLFFWHFQNKHIADKQRTVIWLNGGPGCSSEDGALMEIGPYRVTKDGTLTENDGSWHEFANLLFVDNPVGTGFSIVDTNAYIHELGTMADQFVSFLDQFFSLFPDYLDDDIYIAGESYAGQHIPYIAKAILERNKQAAQKWNLAGLLIGNGWISAKDQYPAYVDFAIEKDIIKKGSWEHNKLKEQLKACDDDMAAHPGKVDYGTCEKVLSQLLKLTLQGNGDDACINMYDVRLRDSHPSCGMNWPPDLDNVAPYLRKDDVTRALHVSPQHNTGWTECSSGVGLAFNTEKSAPSIDFLHEIVEQVPTLLFSGAEDLICNHIGTERIIDNMSWHGAKGLQGAEKRKWTVEGEDAGYWQQARNLTYVLFEESSHMVPFDYPRRSRDMLDRFMGVDFAGLAHTRLDSQLDGDADAPSDVGVAPDPHADDKEQEKLDRAKWEAYRRSGGLVLFIVVVAALVWAFFLWRDRRRRRLAGAYDPIHADESFSAGHLDRLAGSGIKVPRSMAGPGHLEAGAFDESELDDLHLDTPKGDMAGQYALGEDSDDESRDGEKRHGGRESGVTGPSGSGSRA